ncbi:hypothetical protein BH23VER1_BH23VER1_12910 [soil metagenome]
MPPPPRSPGRPSPALLGAALLHLGAAGLLGQVGITEFMASNSNTLADGNGEFNDWVEIHNAGAEAVDLAGWHLTDAPDNLTRWTFPSVTIDPGGYLVVFASGAGAGSPPDSLGYLHASFSLAAGGEYLALVRPDGITAATEFAPTFPPQRADISYGTPDGTTFGFYDAPTPGAANGPLTGIPNQVAIDPPGKVFSGSVTVTLGSPDLPPGATIRYTLNGSPVTGTSPAYGTPLTISSRTHLRTRVFHGVSGPEASAVFLRAAPDVTAFTSNLPVVVLDSDSAIPGTNSPTLVGAHALIFETDPATGRSAVGGSAGYAGRSGLRVRGRSSAGFPKKQFKFETWDPDGTERNANLLGMGGESDWVLSAPYTDKSLMRNALAYSTWKRFGWISVDSHFVEVFLNQDQDGELTYADDYLGVYLLMESISIDDDRVDISKPEDTTNPSMITGGYIVESGNADSQQFTTTGSGRSVAHRYKDPNIDRLNPVQRQWIGDTIQHFEEALYGSGFHHPVTGQHYSELTDVASQVDYKIMREWARNFDGGSQFSYIDRGGKLVMSPIWDYNWALGNVNYAEGGDLPGYRTDGWNRSFTANVNGWAPWWLRFEDDPDWWQAFIDRWTDLRETVLSDGQVGAAIEADAVLIEAEAAARNFARWPVLGNFTVISPPGWQERTTYRSEIEYLRDWLEERSAWIDSQFPPRPFFSPPGGETSPQNPARIFSDADGATIYYTTDGSDPRLPGGAINPSASSVSAEGGVISEILVSSTAPVRALRPTGSSPGATAWTLTDFDDSTWISGTNGVGYENSPADYASLIGTPIGHFPGLQPTSVYTRFAFEIADPNSFASLTLRVRYDDGFVAYLNGHEIARRNAPPTLEWNAAATGLHPTDEANFPFEVFEISAVLSAPTGEGLVSGANVLAIHSLNLGTPNAGNTGSADSDMLIQPELAGQRLSDDANAITLGSSAVVTARARIGTVWGAPALATFVAGHPAATATNTVLTEIHYHPAPPTAAEQAALPGIAEGDLEWIELRNCGQETIDLTGVRFTDGIQYTVPTGTTLLAGAYLVVASDPAAFAVRYPGAAAPIGPYVGALDNAGEAIEILGLDGAPIASFTYSDDWHPLSDGPGFSLNLADESAPPSTYESAASWGASLALHGTPGSANGPALQFSYATWLPRHYSAEEIALGELTAPGGDGDGDGLTNLIEFALGLNPRLPDALPVVGETIVMSGGGGAEIGISFDRPQGRVGVTWMLESSSDLINWIADPTASMSVTDNGDGTERVHLTATLPASELPDQFLVRLRVSVP